ncbi:ABC transporter permease [Dongia sp.]|jgi:putative spermidine/putrescine transport system permease protein|uniref:ABC transporter permease n=1 Tax=Dongia sp. TaxID=1977262 RepID=UPI0035B26887
MMSAASGNARHLRGPLLGLGWAAIALQIVIVAAPLLLVLWLSLLAMPSQSAGPSLMDLSPTAWTSLLGSPEAREAVLNSLFFGVITALTTTSLAIPIAYLIGIRGRFLGRLALGFVVIMWFFDPGMRILGWMRTFKDLASADFMPTALISGFSGELIASIHAWLPPAIIALAFGFAQIDRALIEAARECGATSFTLLRRLLWPLCRPAAFLTTAIVFCGSVGSFLEPRLLGTGEFQQASEWLQRALESETGWPYAAAMLLLMLICATIPLFLFVAAAGRRQKAGP